MSQASRGLRHCWTPSRTLLECDGQSLCRALKAFRACRVDLQGAHQGVQLLADAAAVVALAQLAHLPPKQQQDAPLALRSAKQRRMARQLSRVLQIGDHQVLQMVRDFCSNTLAPSRIQHGIADINLCLLG